MGRSSIRIADGRIAAIGAIAPFAAGCVPVVDARGGVVLPRFIDAHMHLDKTLMGERWVSLPQTRNLRERVIEGERLVRADRQTSISQRAHALAECALAFGTRAIRTHADVTPGLGLLAAEALLRLKEKFAPVLTMQIVAFPQAGVLTAGAQDLLEEALRLGCDVVVGLDPAGFDHDVEGQLRAIFGLAQRFDVPIDIHLHDLGQLGLYELERICDGVEGEGYQGRVVVSHAFALGSLLGG